jgi:hypothetical protein
MKKSIFHKSYIRILITTILFPVSLSVFSQTTFWTETFNNGCTRNCLASGYTGINGSWTITNTGANGAAPNNWFVSCAENGNPSGVCGSGCGSNATLHVGSDPNSDCGCFVCSAGDCGAAYDDCSGWVCGPLPLTNKRAESPAINCTGKMTISIAFNYIENGEGVLDNATVWYYNGTIWAQIDDPPKTAICVSGQGRWTTRTISLPISADNNANVKIGFHWVNNANDNGTDPSFAVDDITVRYVATLPITWLSFDGYRADNHIILNWKTASETNNDYFDVLRSFDGFNYTSIGIVKGSGNSNEIKSYNYNDQNTFQGTTYYKLKQVDYNGASVFSEIISFQNDALYDGILSLQTNIVQSTLNVLINSSCSNICLFEIRDVMGRTISAQNLNISEGYNSFPFNISASKPGIYFVFLKNANNQKVIANSKFIKF